LVTILGGAAATALTQPIDVIRTRLIMQDLGKRKYNNAIDAVETIVKEEGYAGLFKGKFLSEIKFLRNFKSAIKFLRRIIIELLL
jgi:hypothetical protein